MQCKGGAMNREYSAATNGFYIKGLHPEIPADAVAVTDEEYLALHSAGGRIVPGPDGRPTVMLYRFEEPCPKAAKLSALAEYRYRKETGGISVGGVTVMTDRGSQAMLAGAKLIMQSDPERRIDWKGADGWTTMGPTEITTIADAVANHVQACFTAERLHAEAIAALPGDLAVIEAYDFTTGWPV